MSDSSKGSLVPTTVQKALSKPIARPPAARVAQLEAAKQTREKVTVAFFIDATASRINSWDNATNMQTRLIAELQSEFPNLEVQIFCHSGDRPQYVGSFSDGASAQNAMRRIQCVSGTTKYFGCFEMAARMEQKPTIGVMIGDTWENDDKRGEAGLRAAKKLGSPIFAFHDETMDPGSPAAFYDFDQLAKATNGACLKLDPNNFHVLIDYIKAAVQIVKGKKPTTQAAQALMKANPALMLTYNGK